MHHLGDRLVQTVNEKKNPSVSCWRDLVNFLLPWWQFTKFLLGFSAVVSWAAEGTHCRDEANSEMCNALCFPCDSRDAAGTRGLEEDERSQEILPALMNARDRPDTQLEKDTSLVEMDIAAMLSTQHSHHTGMFSLSSTSRFRLEVKEYRDKSRRRDWAPRHEAEMMWLPV